MPACGWTKGPTLVKFQPPDRCRRDKVMQESQLLRGRRRTLSTAPSAASTDSPARGAAVFSGAASLAKAPAGRDDRLIRAKAERNVRCHLVDVVWGRPRGRGSVGVMEGAVTDGDAPAIDVG